MQNSSRENSFSHDYYDNKGCTKLGAGLNASHHMAVYKAAFIQQFRL